jgi:Secretion system C-terminal sorting domain
MKNIFKFIFSLCVIMPNLALLGQIWNGDIYLKSQAQVDSFPIKYGNLKYINGGLFVGNPDTTSTSDVTSLAPLSTLTGVEKISIFNNGNLKNLIGLNHIDTVFSYIYIYRNRRIKNLEGLSGLYYFSDGGLNIRECDSLETLDGLGKIYRISDIYLTLNPRLKSLHGTNHIKVMSTLELTENNITSTNGMDSLKWVYQLNIFKNKGLQHLSGFNQLNYVSELNVFENTDLVDFKNFSTSDSITNYFFRIKKNSKLKSLEGLSSIKTIVRAEIHENNELITLSGLDNLHFAGYIEIVKNDKIQEFAMPNLISLDSVFGTLLVQGNKSLKKIIGFQKLTDISQYARIIQNDSLELVDMPALKTIGTLEIYENPRLKTVSGFENLAIVNKDLNIYLFRYDSLGNPYFIDSSKVTGFKNLTLIKGDSYINAMYIVNAFDNLIENSGQIYYQCKQLDSYHKLNWAGGLQYLSPEQYLDAFENLTSVGGLYYWWNNAPIVQNTPTKLLNCEGYVSVILKKSLESSCPTLENLSFIKGLLNISTGQSEPISFNIFPKLTEIDGGISITDNKYLPYLKGLEHLTKVKKGIEITNNDNLTDCSALCYVLKNAIITGPINISGNPFPCDLQQHITMWCDTTWVRVEDAIEKTDLKIYPNPASVNQELTIELPENYLFPADLTLFDIQGQIISKKILTELIENINCDECVGGLYFLEIRDKNGARISKKISIIH